MNSFALLASTLSALTFGGVWLATGPSSSAAPGTAARAAASPVAASAAASVYYPGCNAVRAAGKAPLYAGQPGYRTDMDGDDDGIACEPHGTDGGSDGSSGRRGRWRR